jgi:hypothetical protein
MDTKLIWQTLGDALTYISQFLALGKTGRPHLKIRAMRAESPMFGVGN